MIPLVSHRTRYVLYYNPKAACTYVRILFVRLHKDELNDAQISRLNMHHNASSIFTYRKYNFIRYLFFDSIVVVRDPFTRIVSGWVDKIAVAPHTEDLNTIAVSAAKFSNKQSQGDLNFVDLLNFLVKEKFHRRFKQNSFNVHFSNQSDGFHKYLPKRIVRADSPDSLKKQLWDVYSDIFRNHPDKLEVVREYLAQTTPQNATGFRSYDSKSEFPESDLLSVDQLWALAQARRIPPRDCFLTERTIPLIQELYAKDFEIYKYSMERKVYHQTSKVSPEQYVNQICRQLNLEIKPKILPDDFDEEVYLQLYPGLKAAGVDPKLHYLNYGIREGRRYK